MGNAGSSGIDGTATGIENGLALARAPRHYPRVALFDALLGLTVVDGDAVAIDAARRALGRAGPRDWKRARVELRGHRLLPLVAQALRGSELAGSLPDFAREDLEDSFRATLLANTIQLGLLRELLGAFDEAGLRPIVMKGLAVAVRYYPDIGTRPMIDVDLLVDASEEADAKRLLEERRFERSAPWRSFLHADHEFAVDLHAGSPSFLEEGVEALTAPFELDERARSLEPHAMLVQLLTHMRKHTSVVGVSLLWIVDVLRLVHAEGASLSLERVRELSREASTADLLLQVLLFGETYCRFAVPEQFRSACAGSAPLSLPWLLRQRRLKGWGFPRRRFYVRYAARVARLRPYAQRPRLRWDDIPQGWLDLMLDRRTTAQSMGSSR